MKRLFTLLLLALSITTLSYSQTIKKREFRGAWIQCVNGQFQGIGTAQMQQTLTYQLNELQKDGVNAIIFQVRPECDALYPSQIEPWSRLLTGQQGMAPSPYWDPLQWMIDECHKRGMELHAWINPFRAKTKVTRQLCTQHIAVQRPDLVFEYDGLYILNPAKQENRDYICRVATDIVNRYDVDGLHIDDYFYPYPASGQIIPDAKDFTADPRGFSNIGDWRRDNVNIFIKQLYETLRATKPWVKFGVSPFGIYRNAKNSPNGSQTNGLQNYDDLYADVLLWVDKGWIDYCVPQLYWQIGHPAADYKTLLYWWDENAGGRPLYIGEDVERTVKYADVNNPSVNQMNAKFRLHDEAANVQGTVLWYAKAAVDNIGGYGTQLRTRYWTRPVLQPLMSFMDTKAPDKVKKPKATWTSDGYTLFWQEPKSKDWRDEATQYVVYKFGKKETINTDDASHIVAITHQPWYNLPYVNGKEKFVYIITPVNRIGNEGTGKKVKIKL